jgi:hypothetical protein
MGGAPELLSGAKLTLQHPKPDFAIRGAAAVYPIKLALQINLLANLDNSG